MIRVRLVDHMGSDDSIARAARVSVIGENNPDPEKIDGLIGYLLRNEHGSPFEHTSMTFHVKAPIFVAREFMRHRIGWGYNEISGRYAKLDTEFWLPDEIRPLKNAGSGAHPKMVHDEDISFYDVQYLMRTVYSMAKWAYEDLLEQGVATEVARAVLPVGLYTEFYATCNVRSLMSFLKLRTPDFGSNPQEEIVTVAREMERFFSELFPITYKHFERIKNDS